MTEQERALLTETAERVDELHRALFAVPAGSPADERPLIEGLRIVWRAYQRGSWLARITIWLIPTVAAIGAGVAAIKGWFR